MKYDVEARQSEECPNMIGHAAQANRAVGMREAQDLQAGRVHKGHTRKIELNLPMRREHTFDGRRELSTRQHVEFPRE